MTDHQLPPAHFDRRARGPGSFEDRSAGRILVVYLPPKHHIDLKIYLEGELKLQRFRNGVDIVDIKRTNLRLAGFGSDLFSLGPCR